jgi:metallo-beta-lactamase class B
MRKIIYLAAIFWCFAAAAIAQKSESDRAMNRPVEPFKIIGNIYYVGASDVTAYLIATPQGHILIDGGYAETVAQIRANVARLGFKFEDIKILLINHAHYDHCGGLAEIKKLTGARLFASPSDAPVLEDGGVSDFRFGGGEPLFTPVKVDEILKDGQLIKLGGASLKTYFTFGHTKGATSWTTEVTENGRKYKVAFVSSLTTLDYRLTNNPKYPQIAADYAKTFTALGKIKPDVFLSSHGGFFDLTEKAAKLRAGAAPNPFIDPDGYQKFIAAMKKAFEDKLAAEKAAGKK